MNAIPPHVEDWIKSQDRPFTIFYTPEKEIVLVLGEKPWRDWTKFDPTNLPGLLNPKTYGFDSWDDVDKK